MEREKNVRNVCNGEGDQEEEKMEEFFALIKSFREARNRRRCELNELEEEEKKKMRKLSEEQSSWVPSFKWEDFTEEVEFRRLPVIFPTPCNINKKHDNKKHEEEEEEDDYDRAGLNLKLTL